MKITLSDGTVLDNLALNGNNFISKQNVTRATFEGKLGNVVISADNEEEICGLVGEHKNMELVQIHKYGSDFWFILRDIPAAELEMIRNRGDIDYVAMMTGVDLNV